MDCVERQDESVDTVLWAIRSHCRLLGQSRCLRKMNQVEKSLKGEGKKRGKETPKRVAMKMQQKYSVHKK